MKELQATLSKENPENQGSAFVRVHKTKTFKKQPVNNHACF